MRAFLPLGAVLVAVAVCPAYADDAVKSGPEVGKSIPGVFHPLNVTGPYAGEKQCLV